MTLICLLNSACSGTVVANNELIELKSSPIAGTGLRVDTPSVALTPKPAINPPVKTHTPTDKSAASVSPYIVNTPIPTESTNPTLSPVPTETQVHVTGGTITAPILLYHQISDDGNGSRYYVTVDRFREQIRTLRNLGYQSITPTELIKSIINGIDLPDRPVLITFDDGNLSVYKNALPIMREAGYVGAIYIYMDRLEYPGYINVEQLQEITDEGWEIGSHSVSHADLTKNHANAQYEILQSRLLLEESTGEPIDTFAYPYGRADSYLRGIIQEYGYRAGMGLGPSWEHSTDSLSYLSRIEIQGDYDLSKFLSLLPWSENSVLYTEVRKSTP